MQKLDMKKLLKEYVLLPTMEEKVQVSFLTSLEKKLEKFGLKVILFDPGNGDVYFKIDGTPVAQKPKPGARTPSRSDEELPADVAKRRAERRGSAYVKPVDGGVVSGGAQTRPLPGRDK